MKDIAIYGAGGFGKEIALMIQRINTAGGDWNFIGFFDDGKEKGFQVSHLGKVLGNLKKMGLFFYFVGGKQQSRVLRSDLKKQECRISNCDFEKIIRSPKP